MFSIEVHKQLKKLNKEQLITIIWQYASEFDWTDRHDNYDERALEDDILRKIEIIKENR